MRVKQYPLYEVHPITDLHQLLKEKALSVPDEIAFRYMVNRKTMVERSYDQFYRDVRALGTYLLKHHMTRQKIAILAENSYYWLVLFFAVITTGNVAVLVSKDSGNEEAAKLVSTGEADVIVYSKTCKKSAEYCRSQFGRKKKYAELENITKWIEIGQKALAKGKDYYDQFEQKPDELAAIFFTSGSTGFSKGVMLTQSNMISDVLGSLQLVDVSGSVMSVLPFTHTFGLVVSIIVPFYKDMPVFICSSLANFMREIPIAKPTVLGLVPLFVETFYKTIWRTAEKTGQAKTLRRGMTASDAMLKLGIDRRRKLFGSVLDKFGGNLELVICGGAPLDPHFVKDFHSLGIEILNGYGITECSPVLAVNRNHANVVGSVGTPLPNIALKIDRPDQKGIGEIIAKGPNVMLGYYQDQASTDEVIDKDGWFHTGDLGCLDKNNFLFVTGRKKSLIILSNGENVSPEEIEQYVDRIDEVKEVVVYADNNAITAEVYPDEDLHLSKEELLQRIQKQIDKLNASLPNYKHIQKLILRDTEFEKTSTRKIKRYKAGTKNKQS